MLTHDGACVRQPSRGGASSNGRTFRSLTLPARPVAGRVGVLVAVLAALVAIPSAGLAVEPSVVARDTFTGTSAGSWGTADLGAAYSHERYLSSVAVADGVGWIMLDKPNANGGATLGPVLRSTGCARISRRTDGSARSRPGITRASVRVRMGRPLADAGVDVALTAHDHHYERFAPLDPAGAVDAANGIRQFIVGTGGAPLRTPGGPPTTGSEILHATTPGVQQLTLGAGQYEWEFIPIAGQTFTDRGSGTCH